MYFVVNIQYLGESTIQSISVYEDKNEALSTYHSTLASNSVSEVLTGFTVMVLNEHGGTELREFMPRVIPVPEVVEEEPTEEGITY